MHATAEPALGREFFDAGLRRNLTVAALGVVYGDIGTSPLYAVRQSLVEFGETTAASVLGVISLITWSLILVVTVKYVLRHHARRQSRRGRVAGLDRAGAAANAGRSRGGACGSWRRG